MIVKHLNVHILLIRMDNKHLTPVFLQCTAFSFGLSIDPFVFLSISFLSPSLPPDICFYSLHLSISPPSPPSSVSLWPLGSTQDWWLGLNWDIKWLGTGHISDCYVLLHLPRKFFPFNVNLFNPTAQRTILLFNTSIVNFLLSQKKTENITSLFSWNSPDPPVHVLYNDFITQCCCILLSYFFVSVTFHFWSGSKQHFCVFFYSLFALCYWLGFCAVKWTYSVF